MIDAVAEISKIYEIYRPKSKNIKDSTILKRIIFFKEFVNFSAIKGGILKRAIISIRPTLLMLITTVRAIKIRVRI